MNFKSKNWEQIQQLNLKSRVSYFNAALDFKNSGKSFDNRATTAVVIWAGNNRYVGVSQHGPSGKYSKELGREIAAGRALAQLNKAEAATPRIPADEVFVKDGQKVCVYGIIPDSVIDEIPDSLLFEGPAYQ